DDLGVERVMPLAREDGRQPVSPVVFHRGEYSQLVVHYYVTARRVSPLNVIEHQLFVNVDQYAPFDGVPQTRPSYFARLENHVAVREDHRRPPLPHMLQRVERAGV